jgi:hypothetical protein
MNIATAGLSLHESQLDESAFMGRITLNFSISNTR